MRLNEFFRGVAAKKLRPVETDAGVSNQHEFNGINRFREIFGDNRRSFATSFLYVDDDHEPVSDAGETTWYDAREADPNRSAEFRLYFPPTNVSLKYSAGDLLILGLRPDDTLLIVVASAGSTIGDQLLWLFRLAQPDSGYEVRNSDDIDRDVDYVVSWILETLGIEPPAPQADADLIASRFGDALPTTRVFSQFAREQAPDCSPRDDPDYAVLTWMQTEERFFRAFERTLVEGRLRRGFLDDQDGVDVDGFIAFSLSVQNRRKSRAGHALENHLEAVFDAWGLRFERGVTTEGRSKPDFLFPGQAAYLDSSFAPGGLTLLGAKASCKDRWRQLLGEADRIPTKHLLTLEPSISVNQTNEMQTRDVQLVLPAGVHSTYTPPQRDWLWTFARFIEFVQHQQGTTGSPTFA